MKTLIKTAGLLALASMLALGSCKKDDPDIQPEKLTEEQINDYATVSQEISAQMQVSAMSFYSKALEKGFSGEIPGMGGKKSGSTFAVNDFNWLGPDAQGWYYGFENQIWQGNHDGS